MRKAKVPNNSLDFRDGLWYVFVLRKTRGGIGLQKKLLTNGNIFRRTDDRWGGVIWYMDEQGERKRKSFSGTTKQEVKEKTTAYIAQFNADVQDSQEASKLLRDSLGTWLRVFKFPSVENTTYDRLEWTADHLIYPLLGDKPVGDIKAADVKAMLNHWMDRGYTYNTVKKAHDVLTDYFRNLQQEEHSMKNPMQNVPMIKKANFLAAQGKPDLPACETVTIFTPEEISAFKAEAVRTWGTGKRMYRQSAAYILMLNTGLRTGEVLALLNSDIDLENRVLHVRHGVKQVRKREGAEPVKGTVTQVGKPKTKTSQRDVPLNDAAVASIRELREEAYFGEETPLIPDEHGGFTNPLNFRKRYYRILEAAGLEQRGLHTLRHTFASTLVNGIRQEDGNLKSLTPRQVADLLGHSTSEITELYYVKKDTSRLNGITNGFEL